MHITLRITAPRGESRLETVEFRGAADERADVDAVVDLARLMARRGDDAGFMLGFGRLADEGLQLRVVTRRGVIVEADPLRVREQIVRAAFLETSDRVLHSMKG